MKIRFSNNGETVLSLLPDTGADEMLIAAVLRVMLLGGKVRARSRRATPITWECSTDNREKISPELAAMVEEYCSCVEG